jgi:hypothetical protein
MVLDAGRLAGAGDGGEDEIDPAGLRGRPPAVPAAR